MNEPAPLAADITPLLAILNHFHPVSPGIESWLAEHIVFSKARKRQLLHREGQPCDNIYFILKGAIRGFARDAQKDITTWINVENQLVSSIFSLTYRAPSIENIQAIENCELLVMSLDDLETMYERFPESNLIARKLLQEYYADAERRAFIARLTKAESRYRHFLLHNRQLVGRIQLKYIASYLGMTLETLSRVRKKFAAAAPGLHPDPIAAASTAPAASIHPDPVSGIYLS